MLDLETADWHSQLTNFRKDQNKFPEIFRRRGREKVYSPQYSKYVPALNSDSNKTKWTVARKEQGPS